MEDIYEIARKLGIPPEGVDRSIERRGHQETLRRYRDQLRQLEAGIVKRHDRTLAQREADRRREIYEQEREARDASRRAAREHRTLGQRLDQTLAAIGALPTGPAARLQLAPAHGAPDDPERQAPPPAEHLDVSDHLAVIRHHVEQIEHDLDVARGITEPRLWRKTKTDDLYDYIAAHFAGVNKHDLARDCPELGSLRTIERARWARGLRPIDGLPRENGDQYAA